MRVLDNLRARSRRIAAAIIRRTGVIFKLRVVLPLAVVGLLTAGGTVAVTSSANAATVYTVLIQPGGVSHDYACVEGYTYHSYFPQRAATIDNDCAVRVWLHQNNNNSGTSYCFPHGVTSFISSIEWENIYIAAVAPPCPAGTTP
jgi:hypothetical protein